MSPNDGLTVAVVGATDALGAEILAVLAERRFPVRRLVALAPAAAAGERIDWQGDDVLVRDVAEADFAGVDLVFFAGAGDVARAHAQRAARAGAAVIDTTDASRADPSTPLVAPGLSPAPAAPAAGVFAAPSGLALQVATVLATLEAAAGVARVTIAAWQGAAGEGRAGMDELRDQTVALLNFRDPKAQRFPRRLAFDVLPAIGAVGEDGLTAAERDLAAQIPRLLGRAVRVDASIVRLPVFVGEGARLNVELRAAFGPADARAALAAAGLEVADAAAPGPSAADVAGRDALGVGRVRRDGSVEHGLALWLVADDLRFGGASVAVDIAESLRAPSDAGAR
ncbi:MAG: aspartate-semialdehyde dehydrogenase [Myxococcales bacterium]|nr:aspartate-semialdehyde dehydrogenase [Myxococcales bacterium]